MNKELRLVQVLRALAASMVVLDHFYLAYCNANLPTFLGRTGLGRLGESGVDLFFVISGFIMFYTQCPPTGTQKGSIATALNFFKKRFIRIMPLYWFWTTILIILWALSLAFKDKHFGIPYLICSYFLIPAHPYAGFESFRPFLEQGWSLAYEMYFYILFAIVLCFQRGLSNIIYIGLLFLANFFISTFFDSHGAYSYLAAYPMNIEFSFGALVAFLVMRGNFKLNKTLLWVLFSAGWLLLGCSLLYTANRVICYGIPATIIVFSAVMLDFETTETKKKNTFLLYLGSASYSIYLTHANFSAAFGMNAKAGRLNNFNGDLIIIAGAIATILLCSLTYLIVEKPLMNLIKIITSPKK